MQRLAGTMLTAWLTNTLHHTGAYTYMHTLLPAFTFYVCAQAAVEAEVQRLAGTTSTAWHNLRVRI